jgi:hypothetical protein
VLGTVFRRGDPEFRLPEAQDIGLHVQDAAHFPDLEVELVRDLGDCHAFAGRYDGFSSLM